MLRSLRAGLLAATVAAQARAEEAEEPDVEAGHGVDAMSTAQLHGLHGKIDFNADGKVSMDEVMKFSAEMRVALAAKDTKGILDEIDKDGDGKLSLSEVLQDMHDHHGGTEEETKSAKLIIELESKKFKLADKDGNGWLDTKELPSFFFPESHEDILRLTAKGSLEEKDADKDGLLSIEELFGFPVDGEELSITEEDKADFARLDKDGSGKVDLEELLPFESGSFAMDTAMRKLFEVADKDGDKHVTAEELSTAAEELKESEAHFHLQEWAEHHEL